MREAEDVYVCVARYSLEAYVKHGKRLEGEADLPDSIRKELTEELTRGQAGAFVSLKIAGRLRGCIGTISPVQPTLLKEILYNAVSAGVQDPRFDPVEEEELAFISVSVDVLGAPEPIRSADVLEVKRYGVIVSYRGRRGLLLPDLEGVETPAQQIGIALQKAGINPGDPYQMERFEVIRH